MIWFGVDVYDWACNGIYGLERDWEPLIESFRHGKTILVALSVQLHGAWERKTKTTTSSFLRIRREREINRNTQVTTTAFRSYNLCAPSRSRGSRKGDETVFAQRCLLLQWFMSLLWRSRRGRAGLVGCDASLCEACVFGLQLGDICRRLRGEGADPVGEACDDEPRSICMGTSSGVTWSSLSSWLCLPATQCSSLTSGLVIFMSLYCSPGPFCR